VSNSVFFIDVRVYIAGILVPCSSVSVSASFSNIPKCTITLPPDPTLYGIGRKDRVPVHVFIADSFSTSSKKIFSGDPGEYVLFFEGEISGFGYVSDSRGKEMVINCQSHFVMLQDCKVEYIDVGSQINRLTMPGQRLVALSEATTAAIFPLCLFTHGMSTSGGAIKYPTELLENAIEFVSNHSSPSKLSAYYKARFDLLKMTNRFEKLPGFDSEDLFGGKGFPLFDALTKDAVMKQISSQVSGASGPNFGSLYEMLVFVLEKMEYEMSIIHNPTYNSATGKIGSLCVKPMLYEAIPPTCNIFYKSMVKTITTEEMVYQVPTRIRTRDITKIPDINNQPANIVSQEVALDYYPTEHTSEVLATNELSRIDSFSAEVLESENHTGPFLYDCMAPNWTSYINNSDIDKGKKLKDFKDSIMKSQLQMKILESRVLSVTMSFNPYVMVGLPSVVYDSDDSEFIFVGYVLSVHHTISKNSMVTVVSMGMGRTIQDEIANQLQNTYEPLTEYTKDEAVMSPAYGSICGSAAVGFEALLNDYKDHDAQFDPLTAYNENSRNICTMADYMKVMGLSVSSQETNDMGDVVYRKLTGDYVETRMDGALRGKLETMATREFSTKIYGTF